MSPSSDAPQTLHLDDGTDLELRPIRPEDREGLRAGFERLSPESRYRRFFGPMPELRERDLDYLTQIDHRDHEALVVIHPLDGAVIAVARFVRTEGDAAEPAVVVADDWQGRGVGSRLLDALATRAREEGVRRFEAPVLAANTDAIRVLERLGDTTKERSGREVQLSITLPRAPDVAGWREPLRAFAALALEPGRNLLDRVRPRRPGSPADERLNVIVIATDGLDDASRALRAAAELAASSGARVEVVGAYAFLRGDEPAVAAAVHGAAEALRERGVKAGEHVRRGDPALVIADVATETRARLIVVGAGGRTKAARRLLGSVADSVAERSPCNVLIVRDRGNEALASS